MKKVLLYGDSNTWGHNPVDCSKLPRTWGEVAQELLPECDITIDGECGRATLWGEGPKHGIACFRERYFVKKQDFDLIAIMLGTNDLLKQLQYEPERTAQALRQQSRDSPSPLTDRELSKRENSQRISSASCALEKPRNSWRST